MYRQRKCHVPCRCVPCRLAYRRFEEAYKARRRAGVDSLVPAGPAMAKIKAWLDAGVLYVAIARATGMHKRHVVAVAAGQYKRIQAITSETILAANPIPSFVDATATRRQLRGLVVAGHTLVFVAREIGSSNTYLSTFTRTKRPSRRISEQLASRVATLCDRVYTEEGPSRVGSIQAVNRGWLPLDAWTDATIGDPNARPWGHLPRRSKDAVDWARVWQICEPSGKCHQDEATPAERDEAVARLNKRELNDSEVAEITGWPVSLISYIRRDRLGLPAYERRTAKVEKAA
jgi:hypothetical protein